MKTHVWLSLFLLFLLTGCGTDRVVTKPVTVEVVRIQRVHVPADLLVERAPQSIPDTLTYGQALELWAEDRATVQELNAQLAEISLLPAGDTPRPGFQEPFQ